jgi:hypothetical protein
MTALGEMERASRPAVSGQEAIPWRALISIAVIMILGAAAAIGPRLVSGPFLASFVEARLCPELRVECEVTGPIHVRLLPYPVIDARGVKLAAPERRLSVSADHVVAELRVLPLLFGRASVDHLALADAAIEIAAPSGGMGLFASADGAGTALVDAVIAADRQGDRLSRVDLDRTRILLRSETGRHDVAMEAVSGVAAWPQSGGELFAHLGGVVAGEATYLQIIGPRLADLTRTEGSSLAVAATFGENRLSYRGRIVKARDLVVAGTVEVELPSAKRFVRPLHDVRWPSWLPDAALHIFGQTFVTGRGIDFENADFAIGRSRFSGGMSLRATPDGRPSLSGTVATPLIELDDLSLLRRRDIVLPSFGRPPDLDLRMSARRVLIAGKSVDAVAAGLILAGRRLDLTVSQGAADDTSTRLHLVATPDEEGVAVKAQASSENVDIGSVLSGFSTRPALTGSGSFSISLEGRGADLPRLERSLSGKASLQMNKGTLELAFEGEPTASIAETGSGTEGPRAGLSRRFSEANFAGIAERGVLSLTEGRIGEGANRVLVDGKLDLAERHIDLSFGASGGTPADQPWRLRVTGPWSAPVLWREAQPRR